MSKKEKEIKEENKKTCKCDDNCDCKRSEDDDCSCGECSEESCSECSGCGSTEESAMDILKDYIKELEDKLLREKAELVNYRRRKDEEVSSMLRYSNEDLIKELLPIVDNFERAIKLDNNDLTDELSKFLDGFKMIYANVINILNKFEVKPIDSTSVEFDPLIHQAVLTEKIDGIEANIVIEVLQKGYTYKEKVIRPAMVKVSI